MTVTMTKTEIREKVIELLAGIAPEFDYDDLEPDEDVRDALEIDSFDFLNFLIAVESEMGVSTPEADYGKLVTMDDIVAYIAAKMLR